MAEAKRDENRIPTLLGVSSVDGTTPVPVYVDPVTHRMYVDLGSGVAAFTDLSDVPASYTGASLKVLRVNVGETGLEFSSAGAGDMVLADVQTVTGKKTFDATKLAMKGTSTGVTTIDTANTGASNYTVTLPAVSTTLAGLSVANSFTTVQTITPTTDTQALSVRRNNGTQASNIFEVQTEANAFLAGFDKSGILTLPSAGLVVGASTPFSDATGTLTLQNIDAIDATTETTLEAALDFAPVAHAHEGTAILSTGEVGGTKYLREDGDGTCSWQAIAAGGNVSKVGTPVDNQIGVWTGDGTIEGTSAATFDGAQLVIDVASSANSSIITRQGGSSKFAAVFSDTTAGWIGDNTYKLIGFVSSGTVVNKFLFTGTATGVSPTISAYGTDTDINLKLVPKGTGNVEITTGIELGHVSDTTITRVSAGVASIEGKNIALNGTGETFTTGTIELGAASDTTLSRSAAGVLAVEGVVIPSISSTNTLTNKRVTKRTGTTTSHATPTINTDNVDFYSITAQTEAITSMTTNLSGTPTEGQTLWIAITGTAARAITWGTSFEASTVALPTTTVSTNRLDVGFVWNTVTSKWRCIATC